MEETVGRKARSLRAPSYATLPGLPCAHPPGSSPDLVLLGCLQRLHYTGITSSITGYWWLNSISSHYPLTWRSGVGTNSSNSLTLGLFPPEIVSTPALPTGFSKSYLINITKMPLLLSPLKKFQRFKSWVQGTGDETKYRFLIISHNNTLIILAFTIPDGLV